MTQKANTINKRTYWKHLVTGIILSALLFGSSLFYIGLISAQGGTSFTISQGIYPGASSYTIWKEDSTYYAKNAYGAIDYSGTNPSILVESCLSVLNTTNGGLMLFKIGLYTFTETINIPFLAKSITFQGENGFGKVISETGATGTHFDFDFLGTGSLFEIDAHSDIRSAYGINFKDIKFEGPGTTTSVALNLSNLDTGEISSCTFHQFGRAIESDYVGSSYPIGEQQGKLWINNNEFAAGKKDYIYIRKATQIFIYDNFFESWGPFIRSIHIVDSFKVYIHNNEFDINDENQPMEEHIKVEHVYGAPYLPGNIFINNNWVWRKYTYHTFITAVGEQVRVNSRNNLIYTEFSFNLSDPGPYNNTSTSNLQIFADDYHYPPTDEVRDMTANFTDNTIYTNNWTVTTFYFKVSIPADGDEFYFDVRRVGHDWMTLGTINVNGTAISGYETTVSFDVHPLYDWRFREVNTANVLAIGVVFR